MKALLPAVLLTVITMFQNLEAQAPDSINDLVLTLTISEGSGIFATEGGYMFIPSKTNNQYAIVPLDENVGFSYGVYNYLKAGDTSAFFIASDSEVGVLGTTNLTFTDEASGTFTIESPSGSQSGTFSYEYRISPKTIEHIDVSKLAIKAGTDGKLSLKIAFRKSDDLQNWSEAIGEVQTTKNNQLEWTYTPSEPREFFTVTVNETVAE